MDQETWTAADAYFAELVLGADPALDEALRASAAAGLPEIAVSPAQGKLLHILARSIGARRILEVGTLGGYSTIWLARALGTGGRLITLELDQKHAEVARGNIERAGLSHVVEVRLGPAMETLATLAAELLPPFDLVFIDADKENILGYFERSLRLARRGSLIIVDNVVRRGEVANPHSDDPRVQGVQRFMEALEKERRVSATVIQTVGVKGYDGLAVAIVN